MSSEYEMTISQPVFDRTKTPLITFHTDNAQKIVGELWLNDEGVFRFEGDVEESAQIFFDHVIVVALKNAGLAKEPSNE